MQYPKLNSRSTPQFADFQFQDFITEERLRPYIAYMGGEGSSVDAALRLYEWNLDLGAAFYKDLAHLEVALRNALDMGMARYWDLNGIPGDWINDDTGILGRASSGRFHKYPYKHIEEAKKRVSNNRKSPTRDQIISETAFGLWVKLTSKSHTRFWPELANSFPGAPSRNRKLVSGPLDELRKFRNRIAHHQKIFNKSPEQRFEDIERVAGYIHPTVAEWIVAHSRVPEVLNNRPSAN